MSTNTPSARRRPTTSVDIARLAGMSQATVSRALNGGVVSEATRQRILTITEELGYSPNAIARGLVMSKTGLIGVVVSDITNPFYPEFLEELAARLAGLQQHMLLQNVAGGTEKEAVDILLRQRVDGIIFTTATELSDAVRDLVERRFPIVLTNRVIDAACYTVEGDNVAGGAAVVDHLLALGHRRIGAIEGAGTTSTALQRSSGFRHELERRGVAYRPELVAQTDFSYDAAYGAAVKLLSLAEPPTALFCHNDLIAFATLNAAKSLGMDVPGRLSVVGFDNTRQSGWESVNLTTVSQPVAEMAARSVELLELRIADPTLGPRHERFPSHLIVRGTTGPASLESVR